MERGDDDAHDAQQRRPVQVQPSTSSRHVDIRSSSAPSPRRLGLRSLREGARRFSVWQLRRFRRQRPIERSRDSQGGASKDAEAGFPIGGGHTIIDDVTKYGSLSPDRGDGQNRGNRTAMEAMFLPHERSKRFWFTSIRVERGSASRPSYHSIARRAKSAG